MSKKRIQLTLFTDEKESKAIEKIRKEFNPEQFELIKSHVTLCRETELEPLENLIQTLEALDYKYITINFGPPVRFCNGKGVLIPAIGDTDQFQKLRELILSGIIIDQGNPTPHITLMHPRNSTCTDGIFEQIENTGFPDKLAFRKISLIEQEEKNKWKILKEFELNAF
jgi:2'-5' RNA ligase